MSPKPPNPPPRERQGRKILNLAEMRGKISRSLERIPPKQPFEQFQPTKKSEINLRDVCLSPTPASPGAFSTSCNVFFKKTSSLEDLRNSEKSQQSKFVTMKRIIIK